MRLQTFAALGAALLISATIAGPAAAQAPPAPAPGTRTVVSTDCVGGGTLVVKQSQLESGAARVVIAGHDVPNGRWKGSFAPDASEGDTYTDLAVTAVRHEFRITLDAEGVTGDTNTTLLRGSVRKACAIGLTVRSASISISSPIIGLVARAPKPGTLTAAGLVLGCDRDSRWAFGVSASYDEAGLGFGAGGIPCRKDSVKISKTTSTFDPPVAGLPTALSLRVHSHGDVRKIKYRRTV